MTTMPTTSNGNMIKLRKGRCFKRLENRTGGKSKWSMMSSWSKRTYKVCLMRSQISWMIISGSPMMKTKHWSDGSRNGRRYMGKRSSIRYRGRKGSLNNWTSMWWRKWGQIRLWNHLYGERDCEVYRGIQGRVMNYSSSRLCMSIKWLNMIKLSIPVRERSSSINATLLSLQELQKRNLYLLKKWKMIALNSKVLWVTRNLTL